MSSARISRHQGFALLLLAFTLLYSNALRTFLSFSFDREHEHYSHIILIPFVVAYLLYLDRRKVFAVCNYDVSSGVTLSLAGVAIYALRLTLGESLSENDSLSLTVFSLYLFWLASFLFCYGRQAFRAGRFPLLFMLLIIPIPDLLLQKAIRFLQLGTAEVTAVLFQISGTPVLRQDTRFALPGVVIDIAPECSGIRSSLALFITGLLAGHLFLRTGFRKTALAVAIIPLAILKNGIRIVSLTLLSIYVDPGFLTGRLHREGGFVFFGITLLLMGGLLWLLQKTEKRKPSLIVEAGNVH